MTSHPGTPTRLLPSPIRRDAIDRNAPNPKICQKYGSAAMVLDQRVFVTFNPFNVYVTQADTKPGCVLRASNVVQQLQVRPI